MKRLQAGALAAVLAAPLALSPAAHAAAAPAHYSGTLPDGATWIADVPADWNGTLVLFSHGFGPLTPADRPSEAAGKALLDRGYALAGSSYDPDGSLWALGSAVRDQTATRDALAALIGRPRRTLALGQSMGGLVSAKLAETRAVDGVLTACGIVGGGADLNNYQLNAGHTIATLLAPSQRIKLTGYTSPVDGVVAGTQLTQAVADAQSTPAGRARIALASAFLNQSSWFSGDSPPPRRDYAAQELQQYQWLSSGVLTFIFSGRYSIEQAAGGDSAWNKGLDYARLLRTSANHRQVKALYREAGLNLRADLAELSATAAKQVEPGPLAWLTRTSEPTGRLTVPALTIHTISDQLVPVEHQNEYARTVRAAGRTPLLRQAYVKRTGHCNFTASEYVASLQTLEKRVKTGHWPSTTAKSLNKTAKALTLDPAAFLGYRPTPLVVQPSHP
ncbi:alpha/beta hydrolase [Actinomadura sp. NAK00032]|uniref:alpha/beta hydrolase n=1 Tax=Actinomadura sp. NAK00032 TaxID=2742128 RepID=UPI001590AA5A|nr:alpha/beta hydrolase [Actinomadura sp. NAK00032]QKW34584.1 alpha/beta hydrolase [Actinomadura sp. NAK00032]